jgi:hypothetical protein
VFDFRSQGVLSQMGMPASVNFGGGAASRIAPELDPEDEPLPEPPLLLVLPPLLVLLLALLPPLPPELAVPDDEPLPPEPELENPPPLLLPLLQPVDPVPERAARPRKDEATQAIIVGWRIRAPQFP